MKNIILIFAAILITLSSNAQEKQFQKALEENTIEAFEKFIQKYPSSEYTEEVTFKRAAIINSSDAYKDFVGKYPKGDFTNRAIEHWSILDFKRVKELDIVSEYENFLKLFPLCEFSEDVKKKIELKEFEAASKKNTRIAYQSYLNKYPDGLHASTVIDLWSILEFKKAETIQSIDEYKIFLNTLTDNVYGEKVKSIIEIKEFKAALNKNTLIAYQTYIEKYPLSSNSIEAKSKIVDLEFKNASEKKSFEFFNSFFERHPELSDDYYMKAIIRLGSNQLYNISSMNAINSKFSNYAKEYYARIRIDEVSDSYNLKVLEAFIKDYPQSKINDLLKKRINSIKINITSNGENIVDLISKNRIEVEVTGSDITRVSVKIRKLVSNSINVQIPPGTFFISHSSSSQNMVTRRNKNILLTDNEWHDCSIEAGCANRTLKIPGMDDKFFVQRSSNQEELEILMRVLSKENTSSEVEQAAIWIVTDNADYDDLGILVNFYSSTRVLNEYEAARAMQICEKAGINIKAKAIWRDKEKILNGLNNSPLKTWLRSPSLAY